MSSVHALSSGGSNLKWVFGDSEALIVFIQMLQTDRQTEAVDYSVGAAWDWMASFLFGYIIFQNVTKTIRVIYQFVFLW